MVKPLIAYYGGKARLASRVVPLLHKIDHSLFLEPFFGGGAVFYARGQVQTKNVQSYREVINDRSEALMNLYRVCRKYPDEFQRIIDSTPYSRADYNDAVAMLQSPEGHSEIDLAWAYFVNINQSYVHKLNGGWGVAITSQNQAATWDNRKAHLPASIQRLKNVHIECDDALEVIKRWDSPQTLVYCDPPYPGTEQGHYEGYTKNDWAALCKLLDESQCSYVLSNYGDQEVEPESADRVIEIEITSSVSGSGKVNTDRSQEFDVDELGDRSRIEALWVCDRSSKIKGSLKRVIADANCGKNFRQPSLFEV